MLLNKATISFRVQIPNNSTKDEHVYITGNHEKLGNWRPDAIPLKKGPDCWEAQLEFAPRTQISYKFTRGSWETEETTIAGIIHGNRYLKIKRDKTVEVKIESWRDVKHKIEGGITGTIKYHKDFESKLLKYNRTIAVWLPPGYEKNLSQKYPVLYLHDGQNIFDPATAFGGVEWQVDETADKLIRENRMSEILVVGIYNTPQRLQEYADTKIGRNYSHFVVNELKPFIDKTYRTQPDRENTAVMGSSMGGLISLYLIWRYPDVFSKAGCLSTSLHWKKTAALKMIESDLNPPRNIKLYLDHGGLGGEGDFTEDFRKLKKILKRRGYRKGLDFQAFFDKRGDHSERSWAKRVWRPLIFFFGTDL